MTTDTPRTDACPHCGEEARINQNDTYYCGSWRISTGRVSRTDQCRALERAEKSEALVAKMHEAALGEIRGPILGVVDDILALRERAEKAEAEVERLKELVMETARKCDDLLEEINPSL